MIWLGAKSLFTHACCVAAGLVLGLALGTAFNMSGNTTKDTGDTASSDKAPLKRDRLSVQDRKTESSPSGREDRTMKAIQPLDVDGSDSAAASIDALLGRYSGRELQSRLWRLGKDFGKKGFEAACDFISNAPPGLVGDEALGGLAEGIDPKIAAQVFEFLQDSRGQLGDHQVDRASLHIFRSWGERDFEAAWEFASSLKNLNGKKPEQLQMILYGAEPERVLSAVAEIGDPQIKEDLMGRDLIMSSYFKTGNHLDYFQSIENRMGSLDIQVAFRRAMREVDDRSTVLAKLQASNAKDANVLAAAAMKDWVGEDTSSALKYLRTADDPQLVSKVISESYTDIAKYDYKSATEWVELIQDPKVRDRAKEKLRKMLE